MYSHPKAHASAVAALTGQSDQVLGAANVTMEHADPKPAALTHVPRPVFAAELPGWDEVGD